MEQFSLYRLLFLHFNLNTALSELICICDVALFGTNKMLIIIIIIIRVAAADEETAADAIT